MSEPDDYRKNAVLEPARRANTPADAAKLLARAERWFRPADQLDYVIRRWVIPVPYEVSRSTLHRASMRNNRQLSQIPAAIGRYLRAEYDLAQPIPARLVDLVRQFDEQQNGQAAHGATAS
jgi:hypothetical protein